MNPYREGPETPIRCASSRFGRWLCRHRFHSYRYFADVPEADVESFTDNDLVRLDGRADRFTTYCIPAEERCRRCGQSRTRTRYESRGRDGRIVDEVD